MSRLFIKLYIYLGRHKWLRWTLMLASAFVFAFYGFKLEYKENILELLPQTGDIAEFQPVFGNLKVKDKVFVQIVPKGFTVDDVGGEALMDVESLCAYCDGFVDSLMARDGGKYISGVLYEIDDDMLMSAVDYASGVLPTFVDTSCYREFDRLVTAESISREMEENSAVIDADEDGNLSMMVSYDPVGLRKVLLRNLSESGSGFSLRNGHFVSKDGNVVTAFLSPAFDYMDSDAAARFADMAEAAVAAYSEEHPEVDIYMHGSPVMSANNSRRIKSDLVMTVGLSLLIICLIIAFFFKNKSSLILLLSPVAYGTIGAMATMYWIKGSMSLMALGIGAIVLGVALSYCLHVLTHYKYVSNPLKVLADESEPVILGCLTTIGAFAGLLFTSSELLRDFGMFASFAMIGTTLFALIFLPHFFTPERNRKSEKAFAVFDRINSLPMDRNPWVLVPIAVIAVGCLFLPSPEFDSNLKDINYIKPNVRTSQDILNKENNAGMSSQYYAASASTLDSAFLCCEALNVKLDSLKAEGIVSHHSNVANIFVPEDVQQERIDRWEEYWNEPVENGKLRKDVVWKRICDAAEEQGLDESTFRPFLTLCNADFETGSLYDAGILPEEVTSNFIEQTADGRYMVFTSAFMPESQKMKVNRAVDEVPGALVVDPFFYTGDMVEIIHGDFNTILWISMAFVFIVLLLSFRCLSVSLIAFLPMTLSWYVVQGIMWIFGLKFNLINIIISSFIFGIGVDYSIFVMQGLLSSASGKDRSMLNYHKTAIGLSAMVLVVVTGSLIFARHPAIQSIGIISVIGMSASILLSYSVEPFLFRLMMKIPYYKRRYGEKTDASANNIK
ncbi:MAG: MMPL family transporter [Candidatus Cryptobacteroides sp.]